MLGMGRPLEVVPPLDVAPPLEVGPPLVVATLFEAMGWWVR